MQEIYDEVPEDDETGRTQIVEQETYEVPDDGGLDTGNSRHDQSLSETYEVPDQPDEQETYEEPDQQETYEEPDQQETYEVPEEPGVCTSIDFIASKFAVQDPPGSTNLHVCHPGTCTSLLYFHRPVRFLFG